MRYLILLLVLLNANCTFGQVPASGFGDNTTSVMFCRNEQTKTVSGNFYRCMSEGTTCCSFNFRGKYKTHNDKLIDIEAFWPGDPQTIKGEIRCLTTANFVIKLNNMPDGSHGCPEIAGVGYDINISQPREWIGMGIIKNDITKVYSVPDIKNKEIAHALKYDVIGILEINGRWIRAEFAGSLTDENGASISEGWIRKEDLIDKAF